MLNKAKTFTVWSVLGTQLRSLIATYQCQTNSDFNPNPKLGLELELNLE